MATSVVLIEIEQRFHADPIDHVFRFFTDLGYSGWIRRERAWEPLATFSVEADQRRHEATTKSTRYIDNFVFTPTNGHRAGCQPIKDRKFRETRNRD